MVRVWCACSKPRDNLHLRDSVSIPVPSLPRTQHSVANRRDVGGGLWLVSFGAAEASETHRIPGQYAWIEVGEVGGYFVLANRAGDPIWDVIVRGGGAAAEVLMRANVGDRISVTVALGRGFPCEETLSRELVIAVPTSAIAVARPIALWRIDHGVAAHTTLLIGARDKTDVPLHQELDEFRAAGVDVIVCLSRNGSMGAPGFEDGYVQEVALRKFPTDTPVFFVAGGTKAENGVRSTFGARGAEVHSNY